MHEPKRPSERPTVVADVSAHVPLPSAERLQTPAYRNLGPGARVSRTLLANRYELRGLLGSGGMGSVYLAHDLELDDDVALKVLRREALDTPGALERFRREVKLARRVTHPNVSRTFDIAQHAQDFFISMEYVPGRTLAAHGSEVAFTPREIAVVCVEVCKGLEAAHAAGVIHRDLKPHNVMLEPPTDGRNGRVVIMDFGIAQAAHASSGQLATLGQLVGTPAYMAPEQLSGLSVDPRADLYALGVMLFELLTGQLPWTGGSPISTALARLRTDAPDPRSIRTDTDEALAQLVNECLCRNVEGRPPSAAAVLARLTAWLGRSLPAPSLAQTLTPLAPLVGLSPLEFPSHGPLDLSDLAVSHAGKAAHASTQTSAPGAQDVTTRRRAATRATTLRSGEAPQGQLSSSRAELLSTPAQGRLAEALALAGRTGEGTQARSVAVLPFETRDTELEYLADGLAEEIIDLLSMTRGLRVRAAGSVAAQRKLAPELSSQELGSKLEVAVVVEGSVGRQGPGYVLRTRVVGVHDGFQLWANRIAVRPDALLEASEQVARAVADALTTPSGEISPRLAPTNPQALDLYFRGRHEYKKLDPSSVMRAVDLLERAAALAPDDAMILSARAMAHARRWFFGGVGTGDLAQQAALLAVQRAPHRAEPHLALGTVLLHTGDWSGAVTHARSALALAPALADAHALLGRLLAETGPSEVALAHLKSAEDLDPSIDEWRWIHARLAALLGQWPLADSLLADVPSTPSLGGWLHLARLGIWRNDVAGAEGALENERLSDPDFAIARRLFQFTAEGRKGLDVDSVFNPSLGTAHSSPRGAVFRHQVRCELLACQGQSALALAELGQSVSAGLIDLVWLSGCPLLDSLRLTPEFSHATKQVEARAASVWAAL